MVAIVVGKPERAALGTGCAKDGIKVRSRVAEEGGGAEYSSPLPAEAQRSAAMRSFSRVDMMETI